MCDTVTVESLSKQNEHQIQHGLVPLVSQMQHYTIIDLQDSIAKLLVGSALPIGERLRIRRTEVPGIVSPMHDMDGYLDELGDLVNGQGLLPHDEISDYLVRQFAEDHLYRWDGAHIIERLEAIVRRISRGPMVVQHD